MGDVTVHHGDCLDVMAAMEPDSVHAVVTDPPYGIDFMGKAWDRYGAEEFAMWCQQWAMEALRIVKPGGHLIAFGATRTHHRLMQGIEDAGWEIRDCGVWLYRSGFPKSLDVSKAIDRAAGAEREVVGLNPRAAQQTAKRGTSAYGDFGGAHETITAPTTPEAQRWEGWGTALKPAIEPWVLARRPLAGRTVAANVLTHGTGALNVDGCRAPVTESLNGSTVRDDIRGGNFAGGHRPATDVAAYQQHDAGRWPANVATTDDLPDWRHFVVADVPKASSAEKPWDGRSNSTQRCLVCGLERLGGSHKRCVCESPEWDDGVNSRAPDSSDELHPTVKPLALMRHLVRLVTPPGGTVLDPFAGTGTTGEAAIIEGFRAVLIEREAAYLPLIGRRLSKPIEPVLFGGSDA